MNPDISAESCRDHASFPQLVAKLKGAPSVQALQLALDVVHAQN